MTEDVLRHYFSQSGQVNRVLVVRPPNKVFGYAFVHFSMPAEAHHALSWNNHGINGQDIFVGPIR
ncbi:hypothetical protein AAVH_15697 [Aphelenchoides avenae]|nr:hypothetical protein AAVH_15697 [Aphelenchus avenae]